MARPEHAPDDVRTWADFLALDEEDRRELIDGRLLAIDVPTEAHERIAALLTFFLVQWVRAHQAGWVYGSGYRVRVSDSA